jgi:hypothetical protein
MGGGAGGVNDRAGTAMERTGLEPVTPCLQSGTALFAFVDARQFNSLCTPTALAGVGARCPAGYWERYYASWKANRPRASRSGSR